MTGSFRRNSSLEAKRGHSTDGDLANRTQSCSISAGLGWWHWQSQQGKESNQVQGPNRESKRHLETRLQCRSKVYQGDRTREKTGDNAAFHIGLQSTKENWSARQGCRNRAGNRFNFLNSSGCVWVPRPELTWSPRAVADGTWCWGGQVGQGRALTEWNN